MNAQFAAPRAARMFGSFARKAPILAVLLTSLAGCGAKPTPIVFPPQTVKEPDLTVGGAASGDVVFKGPPPKARLLSNADAWCRAAMSEFVDEGVLVDAATGGVKNVVVWIASGLDAYTFAHEKTEALVDQKSCVFVPHVLAVRAYQPIHFKNSDGTTHNVNFRNAQKNPGGQYTMSPGGDGSNHQFPKEEVMIPATCDVHTNMLMFINVFNHPYFAVTDEKGKWAFTMPDGKTPRKLPPGKYKLGIAHERFGQFESEIEVAADGAVKSHVFEFKELK